MRFSRSLRLTLGAALLATVSLPTQAANDAETYRQLDQLMDVFERVRAEYVEKVEDKSLLD